MRRVKSLSAPRRSSHDAPLPICWYHTSAPPSLPPSPHHPLPPSRCQTTSSHLVAKDLGSVPPLRRCRLRGCAAAAAAAGSPPNASPSLRASVFYVCVITSRSSAGDRDDGVSSDSGAALREGERRGEGEKKKKKKKMPH